jgi:hypothetical protein
MECQLHFPVFNPPVPDDDDIHEAHWRIGVSCLNVTQGVPFLGLPCLFGQRGCLVVVHDVGFRSGGEGHLDPGMNRYEAVVPLGQRPRY